MITRRRSSTGANRRNGEGKENLCSLRLLLFKSGPGGVVELDFDKSISLPRRNQIEAGGRTKRALYKKSRPPPPPNLGGGGRGKKTTSVPHHPASGLFSREGGCDRAPQ